MCVCVCGIGKVGPVCARRSVVWERRHDEPLTHKLGKLPVYSIHPLIPSHMHVTYTHTNTSSSPFLRSLYLLLNSRDRFLFSLFVRKRKKIIIITQANPHNNNNRDNNLFFFLSCRFSYHFLVWFDIFGILQPIDRNDNADRCFFLITITTFSRLVLVLASLLPSPSFFRTTIQKRHLHAPGSKYRKQLE